MKNLFKPFAAFTLCLCTAIAAHADAVLDLSGVSAQSRWRGADLTLPLSGPVAWQAYVTPDRPGLIVAWEGDASGDLIPLPERRFGSARVTSQEGWSRLEIPLEKRMIIQQAALSDAAPWQLHLRLRRVSQDAYDAVSLEPAAAATLSASPPPAPPRLVVIDPGHGGRDPGAVRGALREKDITLDLAMRLEAALSARGIPALLTREEDRYVGLDERVALARGASASLFVSLHADAFDDPAVSGSSVYTLSQASVPEEHADDFTDGLVPDASVADLDGVLVSLARRGSLRAADQTRLRLLRQMEAAGIALNRNPVRKAGFRVLQAPDVPSVLIEFGYMSNATDQARLADPAWRARAAEAVARAIAGE